MAKKNANPYRETSAYNKVFTDLRAAGSKGISRQDLLAKGHATADVTVVLSPRQEGTVRKGADCRGNLSAQGHKYFVAPIAGSPKRFSLRWRKNEMPKATRKVKVAQKKVATKAKAKAKAPAKAKAKATA